MWLRLRAVHHPPLPLRRELRRLLRCTVGRAARPIGAALQLMRFRFGLRCGALAVSAVVLRATLVRRMVRQLVSQQQITRGIAS